MFQTISDIMQYIVKISQNTRTQNAKNVRIEVVPINLTSSDFIRVWIHNI